MRKLFLIMLAISVMVIVSCYSPDNPRDPENGAIAYDAPILTGEVVNGVPYLYWSDIDDVYSYCLFIDDNQQEAYINSGLTSSRFFDLESGKEYSFQIAGYHHSGLIGYRSNEISLIPKDTIVFILDSFGHYLADRDYCLRIMVKNVGSIEIQTLKATLSSNNEYISISRDSLVFYDISREELDGFSKQFVFQLEDGYPPGQDAVFYLDMVADAQVSVVETLTIDFD